MGKNQRKKRGAGTRPVAPKPTPVPWQASESPKDIDLGVLESVLHVDYPLLDSALISAMVHDYVSDGTLAANEAVLREQLAALEAQVVADAADEAKNEPAPSQSLSSGSESLSIEKLSLSHTSRFTSTSTDSSFPSLPSRPSSGSASRSVADHDDLESEKDLLTALFPHLSVKDIASALGAEHSLDDAVDHLLSIEAIRESQHNGSWADESPAGEDEEGKWEVVMERTGSSSSGASASTTTSSVPTGAVLGATKKKKKKHAIPVLDTLQRRPQQPRSPITRPSPSNIWETLISLATYLSDITPRAQAPWFQTFLHSPDYTCAYEAVLASLKHLSLTSEVPLSSEVVGVLEDVFGPQDELQYCVGAVDGDTSSALDLMDLLTDLRTWDDYEAVQTAERGAYDVIAAITSRPTSVTSSPAPTRPATLVKAKAAPTRALNANRLTRPAPKETKAKPALPPPGSAAASAARSVPGSAAAATNFHAVHELHQPSSSNFGHAKPAPKRNPHANGPWSETSKKHTAAGNVTPGARGLGTVTVVEQPASSKATGSTGNGNGSAKGPGASADHADSGRPSAAAGHFARADEWHEKRKHAMHRATADYNAAPKHLRGQVIGAYRLQAREAAAQVHVHRLAGARAVLGEQRARSPDTIDLHLRTVAESTTLALEAVEAWAAEGGRGHFRVITGKGLHSAGQRGVLGPAVANALRGAGWRVDVQPGYLTVKGR